MRINEMRLALFIACLSFFIIYMPLFGNNLIKNGTMESEEGWEVLYYNAENLPFYEFNVVDEAVDFGRGGMLHVWLDGSSGGQLLLYQRVKCIAGQEYRASGCIYLNDYYSSWEPVSQGPWYQYYVTTEMPDPNASDFNPPGTKMFDISAWDTGCDMTDFELFRGLWESVMCVSEIETAPYFVAPGTPGEEVEVTVGIKFGLWGPDIAEFDLYVDDIEFYPVESNLITGGDMSLENDWNILYYNAENLPFYEFNVVDEAVDFGRGDMLHVWLEESTGGQLLFYQRVNCFAGQEYRASGCIYLNDYYSSWEPVNQGPWYQYYVTTEMPDPNSSDFNPPGTKMFDISAWDAGCDMTDFEQFRGLWESVKCVSEIETSPYFIAPGTAGEMVEVTVGIKFGLWGPDIADFDLYVDDIEFYASGYDATSAVSQRPAGKLQDGFSLEQNYPNPFNPTSKIAFSIPRSGHVRIDLYNTRAELVRALFEGETEVGRHEISIDTRGLPSGIYYYKLQAEQHSAVKKCVVLK